MDLNSELADELIHRGFESPELDYKLDFEDSTRAWMELAKDIFGMSNYGGGHIVFGVEDGTFIPKGMDVSFHKDTQEWIDRIQRWATGTITLSYIEHILDIGGEKRKFPILYVHGSIGSFIIPKIDGKYTLPSQEERITYRLGIPYTRKGTSTIAASGDEYWELFWSLSRRTALRLGSVGTPLEVLSALSKKAEPDIIEETLWFNLFPVAELPDHIHAAETEFRYATEIYNVINNSPNYKNQGFVEIPPFLLEDKKVFSFTPFHENNPLSLCTDLSRRKLFDMDGHSTITLLPIEDWLEDESKHQKLVKLLNYNLKDLCRSKGFHYDRNKNRYYIRYYGGRIPQITWKPYQKTSTRQLVYPRVNNETGSLTYCEHFAGRLRFIILGGGIYLVIEPIRVLTGDGINPLDQWRNIRISTKRNFYYHNNNYLYDMKLWLHILAGNRKEIHLGEGEGRITIDINPINSNVKFGIIDDQHTGHDFLDQLKSEPLEYLIEYKEEEETNPLTESSLEG